jgi:DNA-binding NtrC family response regulator/tetratricopeptide (TPR) repeat protein
VPRLLHDRYVAYDEIHACDLATGDDVRLDRLPDEGRPSGEATALGEVLADAREGAPRWVVADVRTGAQAAAFARRAAAEARAHGFLPMQVALYQRLREGLAGELDERTLLLIDGAPGESSAARTALLDAASRSPRPHVLVTVHVVSPPPRCAASAWIGAAGVVREARAAYGPQPSAHGAGVSVPPEIARQLQRASRAAEFLRGGRHAAAERLLRDVEGTLRRRGARGPAAQVLIALGRALLERGRAQAAEMVFGEAADLAATAGIDSETADARVWQAAARTDAGRLTEAESLCRAVLLAETLARERRAWAQATLARVLCWQDRLRDARRDLPSADAAVHDDPLVAASIDATAVRVLVATGDVFEAGQRARALLDRTAPHPDPLVRVVAETAYLRVAAASGDLSAAEERLIAVSRLARDAHVPLRAARARLVWHDALRRAGRGREAQRELERLARLRRVAPSLFRRAIDDRLAGTSREARQPPATTLAPAADASALAAAMVSVAHDEDDDRRALERLRDHVWRELSPSRIDLVAADAGPVSAVVTAGAGVPTRLGARVLEAGIVIRSDVEPAGREVGVPIRFGGRLLAALVCRWPPDRQPPPHSADVLILTAAIAAPRVESLLARARETAAAATRIPELVGASAAMAEVRRAIERAARAPFAVLIEGESGVGKELAARAIHQLGPRRERPFCDVNCAALPDELLESELFGHARGAYTGAVTDRAGLVEAADGGTLFLDEVADLSARGQAKLLRVLQQQEVRRVGETFARPIDVRLVTAANRDMRAETAAGRFRADLLYRLDVIRIAIPPLRDRPEDLPVLAQHVWRAAAERVGSHAVLTHDVLAALARYHWPGNVRELQNVLAALAVAAPARGRVRTSLLPAAIAGAAVVTSRTLAEAREQFERRLIEMTLARAAGSRTRAAAELGLSRQGLLKTMLRLKIEDGRSLT